MVKEDTQGQGRIPDLYESAGMLGQEGGPRPVLRLLESLGRGLGVERVHLAEFVNEGRYLDGTYEWNAPGLAPAFPEPRRLPLEAFPWWMDGMERGEPIRIAAPEDVPEAATAERTLMAESGARAVLALPLSGDSLGLLGFLAFVQTARNRTWVDQEIQAVAPAAHLLARRLECGALVRERTTLSDRVRRLEEVGGLGVWEFDPDSGYTFWSPVAHRILRLPGYLPDPTLFDVFKRVHPAERDRTRRGILQILDDDQPFTLEFRLIPADGSEARVRYVEIRGEVVNEVSGGRHIAGTLRDLTLARNLEEELTRSQRLETVGKLAGGIAHDFNNLLVPILANARDLQSRLSEGAPERDELDEVLDSAGRARELVQQVLAFSRSSSRKRNATAVDPVVEEVGTLLRRTRPPGIELDVHLEAGDARVYANSGELHQVLMNLATNGLLAMESDSGTLLLATALDRDEGVVTLQVSDTGRGMSAEVTERAFDPFFTTREPGQGTGLGLATVHGIVTGLGGRVELESQPGEGTTVRVHLPELRATEAEEEPAAPPEARIETHDPATVTSWEGTSANAPRILVVDDEETVRRVIGRMLEREGYRVVEAADGAAALETLAQDLEGVDLVITDHAMPKMTGIELATQMKDIRPDLPILLTSGFLDPSLLQGAREAGVFATLDKPYENDELTQLVRRGLEASAR